PVPAAAARAGHQRHAHQGPRSAHGRHGRDSASAPASRGGRGTGGPAARGEAAGADGGCPAPRPFAARARAQRRHGWRRRHGRRLRGQASDDRLGHEGRRRRG
ncbi:MAG: hypothetical protein ACK56I_19955, partial [bacterium]